MGVRSHRNIDLWTPGSTAFAVHHHCGNGWRDDFKRRERWHCAVLVRWRCGCACCDELCVFRWDARNSVGQQFSNRSLPRIRCGRVGVDWFKLGWLFPDDDPSTRI